MPNDAPIPMKILLVLLMHRHTCNNNVVLCVCMCEDDLSRSQPLSVYVQQAAAARCIGYQSCPYVNLSKLADSASEFGDVASANL